MLLFFVVLFIILCITFIYLSSADFCGKPGVFLNLNEVHQFNSLPPYPYNYPNSLQCNWIFTTPWDGFVEFKFIKFHLETGYDYLHIGCGNDTKDASSEVAALHGLSPPRSLTVNSSVVWASFRTDKYTRYWGFVIDVIFKETYGKLSL